MRKTIIGMLVATSLLVSGAAANAADINVGNSTVFFSGLPLSTSFGAALGLGTKGQTFNESVFIYTNIPVIDISASVISTRSTGFGLDITSLTLSSLQSTRIFEGSLFPGVQGVQGVPGTSAATLRAGPLLPMGDYMVTVSGIVTGDYGGSFGGSLNITPVPEASTTAMLLGGLAVVGFAAKRMRRRQNKDAAPPTAMFAA